MATDPVHRTVANDVETETAALGALYTLIAQLIDAPDDEQYRALAAGAIDEEAKSLLAQSGLDVEDPDLSVDDDNEMLSARYNDLFVVGYSEVVDKTDGTIDSTGPPVSLYESDYRPEVSWNDVNLDLARAYEYFGCQVDQDQRRNHDHIRLQLEFMGFLCRREAAVDPEVAAARLDFHDRHLRIVADGVSEALTQEPGTGLYGRVAEFLDRLTEADVERLAARGEPDEQ